MPEMLAKLRRGSESGSPRWERFAMRLVVGHLLAYNIPGLDKVYFLALHLLFLACRLGKTRVHESMSDSALHLHVSEARSLLCIGSLH